jgi:hypothetical protein
MSRHHQKRRDDDWHQLLCLARDLLLLLGTFAAQFLAIIDALQGRIHG